MTRIFLTALAAALGIASAAPAEPVGANDAAVQILLGSGSRAPEAATRAAAPAAPAITAEESSDHTTLVQRLDLR